MLIKIFSVFSILIFTVSSEKFRFDNYTLYKVLPKNLEQIKILQDLQNSGVEYDFWDDPVPTADYINVLSKPEMKNDLESLLNGYEIDFVVTLQNIQEVIDNEKKKPYTRNNIRSMEWDNYYTLAEIYDWLEDLATTYPDVVSIIIGGSSYEGHEIKGVKISHGAGRRAVFIESGIHAREWIAPATTNYIINELLTSADEETMAAARDFDWYIFPVTNPDGYIWSHEDFRLWRKNRRPITADDFGVDLNRNWNDNWLKEGVSLNPSSNTYAGSGPFSEIETRTLSTYIANMADQIDLYLSFHSSGQILLLPFGNTTEPLANYDDAMKIGRRAMGALAFRHGTQYTIGNIAEAIYFATGTSIDWVKERLHVPLVYCYELRDRGTYGHLLPADQILPTGEETMDSIIELIFQAKRYGYMNSASAIKVSLSLIFVIIAKLFY